VSYEKTVMKKYSAPPKDDIEMGATRLSWSKDVLKKSNELSHREQILNQFVKGDSDPIVVIISGCPAITVSAPDGLYMQKVTAFDPAEFGEIFLSRGYRVLYIHSKYVTTPFVSALNDIISEHEGNLIGRLSTIGNAVQLNSGTSQAKISHAIKSQKEAVERGYLLNISCEILEEYIHAITTTSLLIKSAGPNVIWAFCWDLPSHYFVPSERGRRHESEYHSDDSRSRSSFSEQAYLPFTESRVEDIPELLWSFRDACDADGLLVSVATAEDESKTLDRTRECIARQNVDIVLGVSIEVFFVAMLKCHYLLRRVCRRAREPTSWWIDETHPPCCEWLSQREKQRHI
jgi:hypothetical protein